MRYPGALWIPSPNFGYPRGTRGQLRANVIASTGGGAFWHSQVGRQQGAIARFRDPSEEASAHFLFPQLRSERVVQMVDSADAAWHAGGQLREDPLPGQGPGIGTIANLFFHGFEFEGGAVGNYNEALTEYQIEEAVNVCHWLEAIGEWVRVGVYVWRETLQQHRWVYPTACPSERMNESWIIARLSAQQEDFMPELSNTEQRELYNRVAALFGWVNSSDASPYRIVWDERTGGVHVVAFGRRRHLESPAEMWISGYHWIEVQTLGALATPAIPIADIYAAFDAMDDSL